MEAKILRREIFSPCHPAQVKSYSCRNMELYVGTLIYFSNCLGQQKPNATPLPTASDFMIKGKLWGKVVSSF